MAELAWWQSGVVYEIYARSFQDSDGDGIGDLEGIRQRLDHFSWLGVDALWITPIFPSPMADFGYDVADYCGIDPRFGTLGDFDALLDEAHRRGLKIVLDLVPNHSSDQHPWFRESRTSRSNPKRDWYIWRDPAPGGGPPNNWRSTFGGSAWEWDAATGQYYYHAFLKEQPDLNWRNSDVRGAMHDVMRFWFDRGVDGFRIDVLWHLAKDLEFRDNPLNPDFRPGQGESARVIETYSADRPEVHGYIAELRKLSDSYPGRVLIGELYMSARRLAAYYGTDNSGVQLPFNFLLIHTPWNARAVADTITVYETCLPKDGWPNWVLGNHDKPRLASRLGAAQARVAAMLLLTLRGTPTLYYGEELGMENGEIPANAVQDSAEKNEPGLGLGRDPERTPMPWAAGPGAGFTDGTPWLPLAGGSDACNVEQQRRNPRSMLALYRRLLALRRERPELTAGTYVPLPVDGDVLAFERHHAGGRLSVFLNMGPTPRTIAAESLASGCILLSTHLDREGERIEGAIVLRPDEGLIVEPEGAPRINKTS